jgi:hypothetical protein
MSERLKIVIGICTRVTTLYSFSSCSRDFWVFVPLTFRKAIKLSMAVNKCHESQADFSQLFPVPEFLVTYIGGIGYTTGTSINTILRVHVSYVNTGGFQTRDTGELIESKKEIVKSNRIRVIYLRHVINCMNCFNNSGVAKLQHSLII